MARFAMQKTENATERSDVEKFVADSINEAATQAVINFTNSNMANLLRLRNSGSFAEQAANLRDMYDKRMTKAIEFLIHQGWRQAEFAALGKQAFPNASFLWEFLTSAFQFQMQALDASKAAGEERQSRGHTRDLKRVNLTLYCDYHNVLDVHKRRFMKRFLTGLDDASTSIYRTLLSHGGRHRNLQTLDELAAAGVLHLLDRIVFTKERTSGSRSGRLTKKTYKLKGEYWGERKEKDDQTGKWHLKKGYLREIEYEVFDGGKDAFIHKTHADETDEAVVFVDDRAENLRAVCDDPPSSLTRLPHGIEMRRHSAFGTKAGQTYAHATTLDEVLDLIIHWSYLVNPRKRGIETESSTEEAPAQKRSKKADAERLLHDETRHVASRRLAVADHRTRYASWALGLSGDELPQYKEAERAFLIKMETATSETFKQHLREALLHIKEKWASS